MAFVRPAQDIISRNRSASNVSTSVLRYPSDAASHAMIFNFKNYQQRGGVARGTISASNGSVALPLPKTIQDTTNPEVMSRELGITGAGTADLYNLAGGAASLNPTQLGKDATSMLGDVISGFNVKGLSQFALFSARAGLTAIGGSEVEQGLSVASGTAVNPHAALVFSGVALKQYTFEWTLIPNNEAESNSIRQIINKLKRASLPSYGGAGSGSALANASQVLSRALLNYPDMVDVFFVGLDQSYFPLFKTGMISNVTVDYTPQGHVVVNKGESGSRPAMVNLAITIIESEIHTKKDYE